MNSMRLYIRLIKVLLQSKMEYKFSFISDVISNIFVYIFRYLGIWILLSNFVSIAGWNYYEIMFIFNLILIPYGIAGMFIWAPMRNIEEMVKSGSFDSMLIYPINPFLHVIFKNFQHTFLGQFIIGLIAFIVSCNNLGIVFNLDMTFWLILDVLGGVLILSAIMILPASISFWVTKSNALVNVFIQFRKFVDYPLAVYDRWVQVLLTFILPYAFISYYPAFKFLKNKQDVLFYPSFQYLTPVVGIVIFLVAMGTWQLGIKRYNSTGS
jgi:ABC-2 type transport system permease protein